MQVHESQYLKAGERVSSIFIYTLLFLSIVGFSMFIKYSKERLDTKEFKDMFGNLHVGIHLKRNKTNIYYFPIFLARRFIFTTIPIILIDHPAQQL